METEQNKQTWRERRALRQSSLGLGSATYGKSADVPQNLAISQPQFNLITSNHETNNLINEESKTKKCYVYKNKISVRLTTENLNWLSQFPNRSKKINQIIKAERLKNGS